ncbi:hypothetical protein HZB93_02130 [Candidatus Falkowbacteria bacterium]|nr:hypothetical protein [Candidatus Falkowbacteria bacterium]
MDQEIKKEFEILTQIVKSGFDEMDRGFGENRKEHQVIHQKLEDIELRLGNVAYHFEIQDLEKRVKRLEAKTGLELQEV